MVFQICSYDVSLYVLWFSILVLIISIMSYKYTGTPNLNFKTINVGQKYINALKTRTLKERLVRICRAMRIKQDILFWNIILLYCHIRQSTLGQTLVFVFSSVPGKLWVQFYIKLWECTRLFKICKTIMCYLRQYRMYY